MARRTKKPPAGWDVQHYLLFGHLPAWQCTKLVGEHVFGGWGLTSRARAVRLARKIEANLRRGLHPYQGT